MDEKEFNPGEVIGIPQADDIQKVAEERKEKISNFQLNLNLDDAFGEMRPVPEKTETEISSYSEEVETSKEKDVSEIVTLGETPSAYNPFADDEENTSDTSSEQNPYSALEGFGDGEEFDPNAPIRLIDEEEEPVRKRIGSGEKKATSCLGALLYIVIVVAVSCVIAAFIMAGALDMLAFNKSTDQVDVSISEGATTAEIASILHDNDLISHPLIFRLFSKVTHSDGGYQSGVFTLSPHDGYQGIIEKLQAISERETVDVTLHEGWTLLEIAQELEDSGVCTATDFLGELKDGDFSDYEFVNSVPTIGEKGEEPYRIYRFEGYLFPDTYTFYKECSPHAVIEKFFDNFATKMDTTMKASLKAAGMTIDEAVTLASILQQEADNPVDMTKVSTVFQNRLADDGFPNLQSDTTMQYPMLFYPNLEEDSPIYKAYSTYVCDGLPTGPICNPGLDALNAVVNPCKDADIKNCYYFATDTSVEPSKTYYSETYDEHMSICYRYNIGIHASE